MAQMGKAVPISNELTEYMKEMHTDLVRRQVKKDESLEIISIRLNHTLLFNIVFMSPSEKIYFPKFFIDNNAFYLQGFKFVEDNHPMVQFFAEEDGTNEHMALYNIDVRNNSLMLWAGLEAFSAITKGLDDL
jgi:hypothetical protein